MSEITIETYTNGVKSNIVTQEYTYDSSGMKVRQVETVDANADGTVDAESTTTYLLDALNHTGYTQVLEERRVENGVEVKVTTYTIGHDILSQFDSENGYLVLLSDGHGSTRAVANMAGEIVQEYNYDAYGNAQGFDAKEAMTNLLYSGEQFNPVSGLQYLRARWYDPGSGRFNSLDPYFGDTSSLLSFHKYAYGHMNPVGNTDPTGLMSLGSISAGMGMSSSLSSISVGAAARLPIAALASTPPQIFQTAIFIARTAATTSKAVAKSYGVYRLMKVLYRAYKKVDKIRRRIPKIFPVIEFAYPDVYEHHVQSINNLKRPVFLARWKAGTSARRDFALGNKKHFLNDEPANNDKNAKGRRPYSRDEYPYASTKHPGVASSSEEKGKMRPTVMWVNASENSSHGSFLGKFYTLLGVNPNGGKFMVLLVPTISFDRLESFFND